MWPSSPWSFFKFCTVTFEETNYPTFRRAAGRSTTPLTTRSPTPLPTLSLEQVRFFSMWINIIWRCWWQTLLSLKVGVGCLRRGETMPTVISTRSKARSSLRSYKRWLRWQWLQWVYIYCKIPTIITSTATILNSTPRHYKTQQINISQPLPRQGDQPARELYQCEPRVEPFQERPLHNQADHCPTSTK